MEDPLEKANHRITTLRTQLTARDKQLKDKDAQLQSLEQQLHERERQINAVNSERAQAVADIQASITAKEEELLAATMSLQQQQTTLDNAKIVFDQQRAKQAKEMADMKAQIEQWTVLVDTVKKENDNLRLAIATQSNDYQTKVASLYDENTVMKTNHSAYLFELQSIIESQQSSLATHEDMINRHLLTIKSNESQIMTLRDEKETLMKQNQARVDELNHRHEENVKELTSQYLTLTNETQRIVADIRSETTVAKMNIDSLNHWSSIREAMENDNRSLKNANVKLKKDLDTQVKITQKLEKDFAKEIALLTDNIKTVTEEKALVEKELGTKKAALRVYKDEFEKKEKQRIEDTEKARMKELEASKQKQQGQSLVSTFSSLFGTKKTSAISINENSNSVLSTPTRSQHPSHVSHMPDKGFLDLEEEMAVAMTERVQILEVEKSRIEDELLIAQRQLEQERIIAAQLRQQLGDRASDGSREAKERLKKDKVTLSPENTTKVLADTVARNRELEEFKRNAEKEIKRVKAQLEVKKQEIADLKRGQRSSMTATQQGRIRATSGVTSTNSVTSNLTSHATQPITAAVTNVSPPSTSTPSPK